MNWNCIGIDLMFIFFSRVILFFHSFFLNYFYFEILLLCNLVSHSFGKELFVCVWISSLMIVFYENLLKWTVELVFISPLKEFFAFLNPLSLSLYMLCLIILKWFLCCHQFLLLFWVYGWIFHLAKSLIFVCTQFDPLHIPLLYMIEGCVSQN